MNREELEAELAALDLVEKLDAIKAKIRKGDASDETKAEYQATKLDLYNARQVMRQSRRAPAPGDGTAEPELTTTKSKAG